jgi:hypothetical protein
MNITQPQRRMLSIVRSKGMITLSDTQRTKQRIAKALADKELVMLERDVNDNMVVIARYD